MDQVAHQTIVMQFILELAKSLKVDPRGCFRQFFAKIKVSSVTWMQRYERRTDKPGRCFMICIFMVLIGDLGVGDF